MFHKPETSLSWKEYLNQPQVGFTSNIHCWGSTGRTFPTGHSSIYGSNIIFNPQKPDLPQKKLLNSISPKKRKTSPRLVGRIGGIRITGLHLGPQAGGQRFSQWSLEKQPDDCTDYSISKYFGWGGVFWKIPNHHFSCKLPVWGVWKFDAWRLYFVFRILKKISVSAVSVKAILRHHLKALQLRFWRLKKEAMVLFGG